MSDSIAIRSLVQDRAWLLLIVGLTTIAAAMLAWPLMAVLGNGIQAISVEFLLSAPESAGRRGGIAPILVSTLAIVLVSLVTAFPMAFAVAVLLTEGCDPAGRFAALMRGSLDVLAGVPLVENSGPVCAWPGSGAHKRVLSPSPTRPTPQL